MTIFGRSQDNDNYNVLVWRNNAELKHVVQHVYLLEPHVIFFAELLYKNAVNKNEILKKYKDLVFSTADFMASYAWFDRTTNRYTLGPVLIPAQESLKLETTVNPTFELVYWYWGLKTAQEWRKRLVMDPVPKWDDIVKKHF